MCECPLCQMGYKPHQMRTLALVDPKTGKKTGETVQVSEAVYQQLQSLKGKTDAQRPGLGSNSE